MPLDKDTSPIKEIEDIKLRLKCGATVSEVNDAYKAHEFPGLETIESQMALVKAVERAGESAVINQVLAQESTSDCPDLSSIGFKALMTVLQVNESYNTDEIITNFQVDDISPETAQETFAQLVHQSKDVKLAQQSQVSTEMSSMQAESQEVAGITEEGSSLVTIQGVQTVTQIDEAVPQCEPYFRFPLCRHYFSCKRKALINKNKLVIFPIDTSPPPSGENVKEGDVFFALATFVSETGEAMNLVEGERVHALEWNNTDWWYVRKHLTEEAGWVPAQYLKDERTYTLYVQKKLVEKIEKLPVFDSEFYLFFAL